MSNAQWIWYPGDFELMLGVRLHASRYCRKAQINPEWRVDSFYQNVRFFGKFTVECPTRMQIVSVGESSVKVDNAWYKNDYEGYVDFAPGEHTLDVFVFNTQTMPCLYIDNEFVKTGPEWTVTCGDFDRLPVGCWNFTDPQKPPDQFSLETTPVDYISKRETDKGILYDFGKELMAYICCEQVTGQGTLKLFYGESEVEALDTEYCELMDEAEISGDYTTRLTRAFRYVHVQTEGDVSIGHIKALYEYLPIENKGAFSCDNDLVNQIYDTSIYTLHLNGREFFLDGIKRDRWVWSGDASQSYLLNFYSFFDNEICKRTTRMIRGKDPMKTHFNTIQDYTLYWFISLYDYYLYTGDKLFLEEIYQSAGRVMDFCRKFTDERGFIMPRKEDWVFIDWAPIEKEGDMSFIQLLYARALESMALVAEAVGRNKDADNYRKDFNRTLDSCCEHFWSGEKGCFLHTNKAADNKTVTRYTNMFAMMFGYLTEEQTSHIIQTVLLNEEITPITTPFMKFYELMGLCEAGQLTTVMDFMQDYWGGMLRQGATTFWEAYDPNEQEPEQYAMYEWKYGKSLCHAWGAGPIVLLGKYFLGVRPTAPGYETFSVTPNRGGLAHMKGAVPTPTGEIRISMESDILTVENRTQGTGTLCCGGQRYPLPPGQSVTATMKEEELH